jgi:uncharacterized protein YaiE (UPF0345 family)
MYASLFSKARHRDEDLRIYRHRRATIQPGVLMLKHNTYFDDRVQSVAFERNGLKATVGVIAPGEYHFGTGAAERMTVVSGELQAKLPNAEWRDYPAGTSFEVPASSGFDVRAVGGPAAYLCEFLGQP